MNTLGNKCTYPETSVQNIKNLIESTKLEDLDYQKVIPL